MSPLSLQLPFVGLGSEAELHALADGLPHAVFTIDATGTITFWSSGAERLTGYPRHEAVGRPCSILAGDTPDGCACAAGPFRCGLAAKGRSAKTCTIRTRDGRQLRIVKNAVPLLGAGGEPVGALEAFAEVESVLAFAPAARDAVRSASRNGDFCGMVGRHPAMRELYRLIELVARSDAPVIILGESGTGKDLVADAIHRMGPRATRPFVRASCAALREGVEGAGGVAAGARRTVFEEASGGTLLLDEVGDLAPAEQAWLLRVIERRAVERAGAAPEATDVRLLCTSHRDLPRLVADGLFRPDLYFRLAVFPLRVPALRDRLEDVRLLAEAFLAARGGATRLGPAALAALRARSWPGNVRELHNVLEYAMLQAGGGELRPEFLPREPGASEEPLDERAETLAALARENWSRTRAAAALGISRVTLWKRMRRHGLAQGDEDAEPQGA